MKRVRPALRNLCWIAPVLMGIAAIVYGCADPPARAEWQTVLKKAINICYQCIGLG